MHSLIIKTHPRADGFTHKIVQSYKEKQEKIGNTIFILDLLSPENFQDSVTFIDQTHIVEDDSTKRMQEFISQADEIVWVFPVWWLDCPAVMKNFWDRNFTSGFAFRYKPQGGAEKLLKGKTTKVFATAGGPSFIISFFLGLIWKLGRFSFVGMKPTKFKVLGSFPKLTELEKNKFLENL